MGTLYDPVESDLASYQMTFILSPELWEKFNLEGINVDYSKWARVKMMDADKELSDETNRIPNDCGGIYVYVIVSPIIPNGGNYLMYIGKATKTESENLRARVRTYKKQFGEKYNRPKLHNMFTKWGEYVYVYYLPMKSSAADIKEIEDRLIAAYGRPPCNKEILIRSVKDAVDAAF
jgi:hypothetical protein